MTERQKRVNRPLHDRLKEKRARPLDRMKEPIVDHETLRVELRRSEEIAATTVGLMILNLVENAGRTRLFDRAIESALERLTDGLGAEEIMQLEVEAYEVLDWLIGDEAPLESDPNVAVRKGDTIHYDPDAPIEALLREALFQEFDVRIHYFTKKRVQLNQRVISPYAIAADKYVRAWCHSRRAQRVFRLERISECIPEKGVPFPRKAPAEPVSPDEEREPRDSQLDLLSDD